MAIGPTPKHTSIYSSDGLSPEHLLVLATEAAARLGWPVHYLSLSGMIAVAPSRPSQITIRIEGNVTRITSASARTEFFDGGSNRKNTALFLTTLAELRASLSGEYLAARVEQLCPFLPPPEADAFLQPQPKTSTHAADMLAIFRPKGGYIITPIILNLNILVFVLMALSGVSMIIPDSASLIHWGANLRPLTVDGEWWRLLTSTFLHIGATHLFMNMYAFLLIGAQLEPRLGKMRFLAAYLSTGIIASFTSIFVHEATISAGASGAIFGMYGVFLALLTTNLVEQRNRKQLLASILFFVVYNLLSGIQPGIDNAAHVGGLIGGLLIGYGFVPRLRRAEEAKAPIAQEPVLQDEPADYYSE